MATAEQAKRRDYYLRNRERILERRRAYVKQNLEAVLERARLRWKTHPLTPEQRERQKQRSRQHYVANREKALAQAKLYHAQHPEIGKRAISKYLAANREKLRARSRQWYKDHREQEIQRSIECNRRRAARTKSTPEEIERIRVWMSDIRSKPFVRCHWCGTKISGRKIHFDHIVALHLGGLHTISNLCAACPDCNHHKSARTIADWICQGQTFLNL